VAPVTGVLRCLSCGEDRVAVSEDTAVASADRLIARSHHIAGGQMNTDDPIRVHDIRKDDPAIVRAEAKRQFNFSLAVVVITAIGSLAAVATLPIKTWENGYTGALVSTAPAEPSKLARDDRGHGRAAGNDR
jgi:hypothetical protein